VYWTIAAIALIGYLIARGHFYLVVGPRLLIGVVGLLLCMAFGMALGLWTMTLYPRARDVRYFVRYGVQFWMLFTPVFYSLQSLPHSLQIFVSINPLTPVISLVQYGFLDAGTIKPWSLVWSLVFITLAGAGGLWFFNRFATRFVGMATVNASGDDEDDDDMF